MNNESNERAENKHLSLVTITEIPSTLQLDSERRQSYKSFEKFKSNISLASQN